MSILHVERFGPFSSTMCLGLIDQGQGRFFAKWFTPDEVRPRHIAGHDALFSFSGNRTITLLVLAGPEMKLSFFAGGAPALATQTVVTTKTPNTCYNPMCGSLTCNDESMPYLACNPKRCVASERPYTAGDSSAKAAKHTSAKRAGKRAAGKRKK